MTSENQELLKTKDELEQYILRRLGAPTVDVEITCEQLGDCIEDARRWYAAKKGEKRIIFMDVQSSTNQYELPEDVDVVLDVVPMGNNLDFSLLLSPFTFLDEQMIPYNVYAAPLSGGLYSTLVQAIQHTAMAKHIIGAEFEWQQYDRNLMVHPIPRSSFKIMVFYKTSYFGLHELSERDHDLVKRYSLARAKEIVGQVRSKFVSGFPTAQGTSQLNGSMLLEQSEKEIEGLEKEIRNSGHPMPIMIG